MHPLIEWDKAVEVAAAHMLPMPRESLVVSLALAQQHGDLHPGNILLANNHPVLIDSDAEIKASRALDAVTALLSPLFNRHSPLRDDAWPQVPQCRLVGTSGFLDGCPCPGWIDVAQSWFLSTVSSPREQWGLVFGFALRQLKYPDVQDRPVLVDRAKALAAAAFDILSD